MKTEIKEKLSTAIAEALGNYAFDCTRVWTAWSVGTMGEDDFEVIAHDPQRLDEVAEAAWVAIRGFLCSTCLRQIEEEPEGDDGSTAEYKSVSLTPNSPESSE